MTPKEAASELEVCVATVYRLIAEYLDGVDARYIVAAVNDYPRTADRDALDAEVSRLAAALAAAEGERDQLRKALAKLAGAAMCGAVFNWKPSGAVGVAFHGQAADRLLAARLEALAALASPAGEGVGE